MSPTVSMARQTCRWTPALVCALTTCFATACGRTDGTPVPLPDGQPGIGFDDLGYSRTIEGGRVLVPAGRTGKVYLIDPDTLDPTAIGGFSAVADFSGGHDDGVTSVSEGRGLLFATDATARTLSVVDPAKRAIVSKVTLTGPPDYVRYVETTHEVWVTQPGASRIETFTVPNGPDPVLVPAGTISVPGGPEALVIDATRGRAYTQLWKGSTIAIDLRSKSDTPVWKVENGCDDSRGLAIDEAAGLLFAACSEGQVTVLDLDGQGRHLSDLAEGVGLDVIAYSPTLRHLYLAGGWSETLGIVGVGRGGQLALLGDFSTSNGASCVTADDRGRAWVCDPEAGQLVRIDDPFPAN